MKTTSTPLKASSAKLTVFTVIFDFELKRREIPVFRGAVIEKVGRENVLFHNHLKQESFLYGYPLIQYKMIRRFPAILCLNYGAEEILKFFQKTDWDLVIHGKQIETEVRHIDFDYFLCGFSSEPVNYKIQNWFALNEENYEKFKLLTCDEDRIAFLERILTGNILSFAKGVEWNIDGQIEVKIPRLPDQFMFSFKNYQMNGFHLEFTSNIMLPDFIGLGKSVSRGFGMIRKIKKRENMSHVSGCRAQGAGGDSEYERTEKT